MCEPNITTLACKASMSAIGNVAVGINPEIGPASLKFIDLGRIKTTKSVTIEVPQEAGQRVAYRSTPAAGSAVSMLN